MVQKNYDDFIDCPIEIGNHETDGFIVDGKTMNWLFMEECFHISSKSREILKRLLSIFQNIWEECHTIDMFS